ncbi:HAD family hydrolase [Bacteriovorax stolpii]|uniref:D,D-heptose 1,7-bisphosphate phosphatase n=1 Tax=Bacteriovorax stolpii TaxID=960 RepID=A0A2K9NRS3_BACTC|nr:HAD family hydrolase [Bacteriovorax stolpii]AUN98220.1 D,D-heptose 1,7-bisphosphate phosphatase [Bacteriovorax stolpii]QDK41800.1 HAD family hydrolase [Bacteriovorax stolpii]TDP52139.1 D-alpha,beta-D-heptose 1,7-bisphosphate phosphatase [Bacteriovorax stolpii]
MHKALFLDRDGIVNIDKGYVYKWEDIIWIEEIFQMIKLANERGYKVIVLTNQSGIDRGMYTHEDVHTLHQKMHAFLAGKNLKVDDWFYCAEMDSELRKPRPGMLILARDKHDIDLTQSFMIGDKPSDVFETDGKFVGPSTLLVEGNYDLKDAHTKERVKVFKDHAKILEELKKVL